MIKNGLRLFITLLLLIFYESLENHLKVYYVLKILPFDTFFLENIITFSKNFG